MDHRLLKNTFCLVTATSRINNIFHFYELPRALEIPWTGHLKHGNVKVGSGTLMIVTPKIWNSHLFLNWEPKNYD